MGTLPLLVQTKRKGGWMTSNSTSKPPTQNAVTKRRLKALRSLPVTDEECEVPGCKGSKIEDLDCCYRHCHYDSHNNQVNNVPNDGIIDQVAIDIAVQGARPVRLSRVEKDIAIARLLKSGMPMSEVSEHLGISWSSMTTGRRAREIKEIMEALPDVA